MKKLFLKSIFLLALLTSAFNSFGVITITPTSLSTDTAWCQGSFNKTLKASGGVAPYTYTVTVGTLPTGFQLNRTSGNLGGSVAYKDSTSVTFTVRATDKTGAYGSRSYTIYIRNKSYTQAQLVTVWNPTNKPTYFDIYNTWYNSIQNTIPSSSIDFTKTIFVSETGNDATGEIGNPAKPFLTFIEAQNSASAGMTIHVTTGSYTGTSLGKDSVDYYFEPNTYVTNASTSAMFTDAGTVRNFNVYGYGNFISTGPILQTNGSFANTFELQNGSCAFNKNAFYARVGTSQNILLRGTLIHTGYSGSGVFEALLRSDNGGSGGTGGKITISGSGVIQSQGFIAQTKQGSTHNGVITINVLGGCELFTSAGVRAFCELNGGSIIFNCALRMAGTSAYGLPVFRTEGDFNTLEINGNVTSTMTDALLDVGVSGTIYINGKITATSGVTISGASCTLYINGNLTTNKVATPSLNISNGVVIVSGRLKNIDTDSVSDVIFISGGKLILQNCVLFGANGGNTVSATTPQNMYVYSAYSNSTIDVDVTQVINTVSVNPFVQ